MAIFKCEKYKPRICRGAEAGACASCGRCLPGKRMSAAIFLSMSLRQEKDAVLRNFQEAIFKLGTDRRASMDTYEALCQCRRELVALDIKHLDDIQQAIADYVASRVKKNKEPNEKTINSIGNLVQDIYKRQKNGYTTQEIWTLMGNMKSTMEVD